MYSFQTIFNVFIEKVWIHPTFRWYPFTKFHKYPKPSLQMNILQKVYCSWKQKTGEDNPSFPDIPIINKKQCWGASKEEILKSRFRRSRQPNQTEDYNKRGAVVHIRCGPAFHMWSKKGATEMRWNHHESSSESSLIFVTILTNKNRELHSSHMAHTYGGHHKKQPNQYKEGKISENWIEKKWVDNS